MGPRLIDLHLSSLEKLGVKITEGHGYLDCRLSGALRGAAITLPFPSVGATENILLAACTAKGETVIHNPAREPEIDDLIGFLNRAGADIGIREGGSIYIRGVHSLGSVEYSAIPDRIAGATYLCCAAITGGSILLKDTIPEHMTAILPILEEMGCSLDVRGSTISLKAPERLRPAKLVRTMPYPGFPTDMQAPLMSLCCLAQGTSVFVENIFESRYKHVCELARMGAKISVEGRVAVVEGVSVLHGAPVVCTDLRGGAALVVAALATGSVSEISEISHIERGYQNFDKNLSSLGAIITTEE